MKGAEDSDHFIYGETHDKAGYIVQDTCLRVGRTRKQVIEEALCPDFSPETLIENYEESKALWLAILGRDIAARILKRDSAFFRGIADIIDKHFPNGGKWPAVDIVRAELKCFIEKKCFSKNSVRTVEWLEQAPEQYSKYLKNKSFIRKELEDALSPAVRRACSWDTISRAAKQIGIKVRPGKAGRPREK